MLALEISPSHWLSTWRPRGVRRTRSVRPWPSDLAPQHPQLDQPNQEIFGAVGAQAAAAEAGPIAAGGQLGAAEGALLQLLIEGQPKGQAAHGLAGAPQGVLVGAGCGGSGHALGSLAVILLLKTAA